tara:strand:- start:314 stop:502 length:189 start_codon:yes stop_codon:yes gene_type:complete
MATLKLSIEIGNDYFSGAMGLAIGNVLKKYTSKIEDVTNIEGLESEILDFNGNTIGQAIVNK